MEETYIGMDFGGTKLLVGEVDANGRILGMKRYTTGYVNQTSAVDIIKDSLIDYLKTMDTEGRTPAAIGIGLIGRVDTTAGRWLQIDASRSNDVALAQQISDIIGIPCYLANDVKSATIGEMCWGHGRTSKNFVYINIGTGIAAGTVIDGRLTCGSHFNAGEVGHTQVGVQVGTHCVCGRTDCAETIAAGVGFDMCARLLAPEYPESKLTIPSDGSRVDVRQVYALAQQGDSLCIRLVENAAQAIANLIMNLVRVSDPDTVVLGGGIVSDKYMFDKVLSLLHPHTMRFVTGGVVPASLDPAYAGLLGAAAVAMTNNVKEQVMA
ncbi:MAG: ROK family protein [Muribaculaceae bacterium]|nr:ROK family protein [Muribaculaceae bacterium]